MALYDPGPLTRITMTWPSHPITRNQLRIPRSEPVAPLEPTRPAVPYWPISAELDLLANDFGRSHADYVSNE
jgi:hypothetical protein